MIQWSTVLWVAAAWLPLMASGADSVLEAITDLEGRRDPKCAATAARLEDFMYGTPLTAAARFEKNRRLKIFARQCWQEAADSEGAISLAAIGEAVAGRMKVGTDVHGDHRLEFPGQEPVTVAQRDLAHYGSVAYSLRAILSVQQEAMLDPELKLPSLAPEAVEEFKRLLDLLGLAVLQAADGRARAGDCHALEKDDLVAAWEQLLGAGGWDGRRLEVVERTAADGLLKQLVSRKLKSYQAYNQINNQLLVRNMQVYYARLSWPRDPDEAAAFRNQFISAVSGFGAELYLGAAQLAKTAGHTVMREVDVDACVQHLLLPHRLNAYEDVIYFPRFDRDERITIEAYDLDSFRDSGVHWQYLEFALEDPRLKAAPDADPFACELLAENVAQFGVLLLRMAGMEGVRQDKERLSTGMLQAALEQFGKHLARHQGLPPRDDASEGIRSAAVGGGGDTRFEEITEASGIQWMHRSSDWLNRLLRGYLKKDETTGIITIPPAFGGSGVAAGDVNGDGRDDVLLLSGLGNRLYAGLGDGRFKDITEGSGLEHVRADDRRPGESRQPLIADFDNDGHQDVLITYVEEDHRLYRGRGDGTFEDVTAAAGLGGAGLVGGPATTFDFDNDGLLDVYIAYFGDYPRGQLPTLKRRNSNGLPNQLFRNLGGMRFENVTERAGVADSGWGQAAAHTDFDGDHLQDLIVGNDFGVNVYYRNQGDGTFKDVSDEIGTGKPSYTMSIGTSDLNRDLIPDIYISNIVTMNKDEKYVLPSEDTRMKFNIEKLANMRVVEANDLFLSSRGGKHGVEYALSDLVGRGYSSTGWAWDADFFDADNDGDDDLYVLNGMNEFNLYSSRNPYFMDPDALEKQNLLLPVSDKERNVFFRNEGGKLTNASKDSGLDFAANSRSAVYLDIDDDGDLDIVTNDYHGPARVFRNTLDGGNWIKLRLTGDPAKQVNRDAIGAKVIVTLADGTPVWREVQGSTGYLSVHPKTVHVGLGGTDSAEVRVIWPDGREDRLGKLKANALHEHYYTPGAGS